ncbi:hypothetical protein [Streptomyces sp. NPDC050704]|uniref:hypothetical protein n=1 Tax=Streptomyces sp. NPDC050704 TaxID=3157219 RepID=UPI003431750D
MTDLIRRLMTWAGLLLIPLTPREAHPVRPVRRSVQRLAPRATALPAHRSPYGLDTPPSTARTPLPYART